MERSVVQVVPCCRAIAKQVISKDLAFARAITGIQIFPWSCWSRRTQLGLLEAEIGEGGKAGDCE